MLNQKIEDKTVVVAVLGLGHVGYPMATLFAKNGFQTIGYDIDRKRLGDIRQSKFDSDRQKEFMDNYKNEISNKELEDLMNMFYNQ